MPALLPILLTGTQLVLASATVPELDVKPSCHAATTASMTVGTKRDEGACMRDENSAHDKLGQDWASYPAKDQSHCLQLTTLGGSPSYVELLTCLELSKQAAALRQPDRTPGAKLEQ